MSEINIDLDNPEYFLNRELSLLDFNRRVLDLAEDESVPLLERLQYLCISSRNLDEFFEVRVAGYKQMLDLDSLKTGPDKMTPDEVLRAVHEKASIFVEDQYRILNENLIPLLEKEHVKALKRDEWNEEQAKWLSQYFEEELLPVLSPIGLDPAHPFPKILNKSLNFIVSLTGKDAFGRNSGLAIVQAPRALPRLIQFPKEISPDEYSFVFLSSVIHAFVGDLFHGMTVNGCYQFRITRNSDLFIDDEDNDDLLHAVAGELHTRHYGDSVRMEVAHNSPDELVEYLSDKFQLKETDIYKVNGPVNLARVSAMVDIVNRPDLKYPVFNPAIPKQFKKNKSIFSSIREGDILLHHPYESFLPVINFVRQASEDPNVLAIKQTLYRTGPESAIASALVAAARAGKEVTVVIELRARFDEEANVALASRLQEAGVHVVYGVVGYKTHAKMILVIRREASGLRHYVHMGTGNYHPKTSRLYTDYGLFTCDQNIGEDVYRVFLQLTSLGKVVKLNKLLQAPFSLHDALMKKIRREKKNAEAGKKARIIVKINSLLDKELIQAMYEASMANVQIDLVIRGICALRPGIPEVSENIKVHSVLGRFLEHSRVFYFENDGKPEVYASSADWMPRNLYSRVEIAFPIEQGSLKKRIISDLEAFVDEKTQKWILDAEGKYTRTILDDGINVQQLLLDKLSD